MPVDGVLVKQAGPGFAARLLSVVDQRHPLLKIEERKPVTALTGIRHKEGGAGTVMVFQKAQLDIVVRIEIFLPGKGGGIGLQRLFSAQQAHPVVIDVVLVAQIKRLIDLAVRQAGHAPRTVVQREGGLHRLAQPQAVRPHPAYLAPRAQPELQRHKRRHIAAKTVHHGCPHLERFDLVIPQFRMAVIQINDVRPLADSIAKAAIRPVIEPFGMVLRQPGVRRGVVIDHVDHQAHAQAVNLAGQALKILHRAVFLIDGAIIPDGIRASKRALSAGFSDGVNGQEPENIHPEIPDARKVLPHLFKRTLFAVLPYIYAVHHLLTKCLAGICRHAAASCSSCLVLVFFAQPSFSCHQPLTAAEAMPCTNRF